MKKMTEEVKKQEMLLQGGPEESIKGQRNWESAGSQGLNQQQSTRSDRAQGLLEETLPGH